MRLPDRRRAIMRLAVFCGRYGHQQRDQLMRWTMEDLQDYAAELEALLRDEKEPAGVDG